MKKKSIWVITAVLCLSLMGCDRITDLGFNGPNVSEPDSGIDSGQINDTGDTESSPSHDASTDASGPTE